MKYVSPEYQKRLEDLADTLVLGRFAAQAVLPGVTELYPDLPETAKIYDFPVAAELPPTVA